MNYQPEHKIAEGYLQKQKRRVKNGQTSSTRYFKFSSLDKDRCFIMKVKHDDNSSLKTYNAKQIKGFTDKLTKEENIPGVNSNFSFKIVTTIKPYILAASNKEEFKIWIKTLQKFTEANSTQNNFTDFSSKFVSPNSNSIGQTQVEFEGLQFVPQNLNSSSGGNNSRQNNSKLKSSNNLDGIVHLNNSSKNESSYANKQFKNVWDADGNDSEEERDILHSRADAKLNKNITGNAIIAQNGNFGSSGNFGTFGSNKKLISGPNSNSHHQRNQLSLGSMKYEDNNKINDNRLKNINEIIPFESEYKNSSSLSSYPKTSPIFMRDASEKLQVHMPIDSYNAKNNSSLVNSSQINYSAGKEEKIIYRHREVGLANKESRNSFNNKYQQSIGKFEILGETSNNPIKKNFVLEGINKKEEKGIIPLMENVKPIITSTGNQSNSDSLNNNNNKLRQRDRELTFKSPGSDSFKMGKTNFIVEFSGQDFFETSLNTQVLPNKEEEGDEFHTLKSKQQSFINNSNSMSMENTKLKSTSYENTVKIREQSKQNFEKYEFISEDSTKLPIKNNISSKNQISIHDTRATNKANNLNTICSETLKIEESKLVSDNQATSKPNYLSEDLSADFPKLKTKSDKKIKNKYQENYDTITKNNKDNVSNFKLNETIFDENIMHIKQGLNSTNNKIILENLNFCPTNIYNVQDKPMVIEGSTSHSPQGVNTKRILSSRKHGFKEELRMNVPPQENSEFSNSQNKDREIIFTGKQNIINKILGSSDPNTLYSKSKRYINTYANKAQKDSENKNMVEVPNIDYIQPNKNAIKVSIDKFALKKDLNHMNVQNTYQLDAHTVLQDEFHIPMDKVINFQHRYTHVYDFNDQTRNNAYLSDIHVDQSSIVGGYGDMDTDKTFLEEINKINQIHLSNSYSLLDVDEDWNSNVKNKKENYDSKFEI